MFETVFEFANAVRKSRAQIQRRMRPALIAGIARQMQVAATHPIVKGRQHFLLDLRHLRLALRLFETQRHCDVAGEFCGAVGIGVVHCFYLPCCTSTIR